VGNFEFPFQLANFFLQFFDRFSLSRNPLLLFNVFLLVDVDLLTRSTQFTFQLTTLDTNCIFISFPLLLYSFRSHISQCSHSAHYLD
ncbi:hypothetical protein PFISCL1PPCAC_17950, partial [Pristionchus fissidentatus]